MGGGHGGQSVGGPGVLPGQFHQLLHGRRVLVGPGVGAHVRGAPGVLLQHGGDGGGRGQVEERRVHGEGGGMDEHTEAQEDISLGVFAAYPVGFRRQH